MKNRSELLDVLATFRTYFTSRDTLLLATSAYVSFTKRQLWEDLIKPLGIYKNLNSMCFDPFVKSGLVSRFKVRGGYRYELSQKGYDYLPSEWVNSVQVLVDGSSEEVNSSDDQSSCDVCVPSKLQTQELTDQEKIIYMCDFLEKTLLSKNESYGNSSLKPLGIFPLDRRSKVEARMEDKISRLRSLCRSEDKEALFDTLLDLAGYSILYTIILEDEK